jgi:hypothetical protein
MNAFSWISFISGFLALVLNIYLVPLIVFYSSQNIGSYKYLLLVYTITSVIYTVAQLATLPVILTDTSRLRRLRRPHPRGVRVNNGQILDWDIGICLSP